MAKDSRKHGIGTRTLRGMVWAYGSYAGGRAFVLVSTAILARIVTPDEFGLVALALSFLAFLDMLQGLGVGDALVVADEEETEDSAETVFAINMIASVALVAITAALGPVAASFFDEPALVAIMPALGLNFVLIGLGATHYSLAQKQMDFRSRTVAEVAEVIARGVVGIVLALAGAGVWSLVVGYLAGSIASTVVLWWLVRWRPRLRPQWRLARGLLSFGGTLTGVGFMAALLAQFDNLVIGRVLGTTQLGYYTIATRLPQLLIINLAIVAGQVLFPAFTTLSGEALQRGFLVATRYAVMVALPLTAVLGVLAEPLTIGLFGDQWQGAVTAAQVLSLWALMSPIGIVCGTVYKSQRRVDLMLKLAVPQAILLVVGSVLLAPHGIVAVAWLQAGIALAATVVSIWLVQWLIDLRTVQVLRAIAPPTAASAALALVLFAVDRAIDAPWPTLAVALPAGALVYVGVLAVLARDTVSHLRAMAFPPTTRSELEADMLEGAAERVGTTPP